MSEVFQGINSRVSKLYIQSELIGSPINNITRSSKNVINIEISEPPFPPYNDSIMETTSYQLILDINEGELRNNINTTKANINIEISEPLLFDDKTYIVYLGNTEISDVYIGNNLLTDISFIIT